jgi:hypothetical protein
MTMASTTTTDAICLWRQLYRRRGMVWVVSIDTLDDRGNACATRTLFTSTDEGKSAAAAERAAKKRGLTVKRF